MGVSNIKLKGNIANKKIDKIFILLVAIILLFLGSICSITDAAASDNNATKIEIIFPPDASVIGMNSGVQGIANVSDASVIGMNSGVQGTANVPDAKKLWIVVSDGNNYFPQTNVTFNEKNTSEWFAAVELGGEDNGGLYYRIDAVLANATASKNLTDNSKKPIPFLPEGTERVDYVVVERVKYPSWKDHADAIIGLIGTYTGVLLGAALAIFGPGDSESKKKLLQIGVILGIIAFVVILALIN